MLTGPSDITVDAKGRFLFPAKYRDYLHAKCGGLMVVVHDLKGCLTIYTQTNWTCKAEALAELPDDSQELAAYFMGSSEHIQLDSAGRLALTPEHRKDIGLLPGPAVLRGVGSYFELWSLAQDEANKAALREQLLTKGKPASLAALKVKYVD